MKISHISPDFRVYDLSKVLSKCFKCHKYLVILYSTYPYLYESPVTFSVPFEIIVPQIVHKKIPSEDFEFDLLFRLGGYNQDS